MADASHGATGAPGKRKLFAFTAMLLVGLVTSQVAAGLPSGPYKWYSRIVGVSTMFCLSFLMVNVGHEFEIDKSNLKGYGKDYAVAMSAAGLPWIFVAVWLYYALPGSGLTWGTALLIARFAAPTSAGILFSMLEAAGFKETWLFRKARILAIFDDLDTILLMIPLKMILVGAKWELAIDAAFVSVCLAIAWQKLHRVRFQSSWSWTLLYSFLVTGLCEGLYFLSQGRVHVEVLLPAFALGCVTRMCQEDDDWCEVRDEEKEERVKSVISTFFMLLVGMSMPALFTGGQARLGALATAGHVFVVTILMIIGKMLLLACYKDESDFRTRLALSLGMCPRGEVGAGVIAISLGLGMRGPAITIAVLSLAVNLLLSTGFIMMIDRLMRGQSTSPSEVGTSSPSSTAALPQRLAGLRQSSLRPGFRGLGLSPRRAALHNEVPMLGWAQRPLLAPAGLARVPGCFAVPLHACSTCKMSENSLGGSREGSSRLTTSVPVLLAAVLASKAIRKKLRGSCHK
eukprot:TRINITY_DN17515_c0_g1_i1.p1 TRINITY_DN17515_c0_g1~~TRINITY_DN17515_c0_g1_i1.p1  ORF type:complete len:514 (+),score=97.76 TRINITY_DN17515_c0_g1_i1:31-1572(+)